MLASTSEEHGRIGDCPQSDTDAQDEQLYEDLTSFSSTVSGVAYDDGRARTGATLRPNSSSLFCTIEFHSKSIPPFFSGGGPPQSMAFFVCPFVPPF